MISSFQPARFKCFIDENVALGQLTILAGVNGAGKSSFIQALLLAHACAAEDPRHVALNGPFDLALGRVADVVNQSGGPAQRSVALTVRYDDKMCLIELSGEDDALVMEQVDGGGARADRDDFENMKRSPACVGLRGLFEYLTAERIGPRDIQAMEARPAELLSVGARGEHTAQVLLQRERERIREPLLHPRTKQEGQATYLGKQVELWMQELVPGLQLRPQAFEGTNAVALRMRRAGATLDWLRPTNMAFGVSYALPIVVAGLLAGPGALVVIENPEAHLHPSAQSRMGRFLATLAAADVQVIVETHSDHVLNGVRLAVAQDEHPIKPEHVVIQHFAPGDGRLAITRISVDAAGGLSEWPAAFFDQTERDLGELVRQRRGRRK